MSECDDSASVSSSPVDEIPRSSSPVERELSTSDGDEFDNGGGDRSRAGTAASEGGVAGLAGGISKSSAVIGGEGERKRQTLNTSSWKRSVVINAPHILLETINARTAGIIIVATYLCFIVSFIIDFNTTYTSFNGNNNDFRLGSRLCSATNASLQVSKRPWGCWSDVKTWHGTVDNLSNVLLVTLAVRRDNFTLADAINSTADPFLFFNVNLFACFLENGCGSHFVPTKKTPALKVWQKVLSTSGYSQSLLTTSDLQLALSQQPLEGTFFSIFQNQESLPTNGLVKSYYVQVSFLYEQTALISATSSSSASSMSSKPSKSSSASLSLPPQPTVFVMSIASRPPSLGYNVATILLFIATVFVLATYILMMRRKAWSEWLQEQKWLVVYLVCIILYQNPIYIIVNFHATAVGAFLAYFISDLAQACLLVVWLLFADSVHLQEMSPLRFYAPKVLAGLAIFLANLIVLSFQFPSFSPESGRNPVESVYNWRSGDKLLFIGASMCFLVLFWLWALVWFATIYLSQQKLDSLSYMSTRYLQLSFRFFFMQATLVTVYYILQYAATIYFISVSQPFKQNVTTLTDNINVLFRQQTQLFGKTLFLTVYGAILAFLFLPADILGNDMAASLAATYAVSIKELELLVRKRKRTIRKQSVLMNQVVSVKPHIFCVDLALSLLEVAFEAYNDSDGKQRHGYLVRERAVAANLQPFGYSLVEIVEDKTLDILLLVARHTESKRLVFAFRGTRSTKNMGNNLDYAQKDVDIGALSIPDVANTTYLSGVVGADVAPASPDLEDAESDDSSNQDTAEEGEKSASAVDCGSANIFEMAFRFLASALQAATTNALHVGGEFVLTAASVTPGLNQFIRTSVHSGFWKAYIAMRGDVHRIVFKESKLSPGHLIFTGHSLGGALATLACIDIQTHAIPRINQYWRQKRSSTGSGEGSHEKVKATMYNFGCPRVGNRQFVSEYNQLCPDSFRIVVDGDFFTSIPKTGFVHAGTEVVVDSKGAGSIIVDPSFVEQWLRSKVKNSLRVHLMGYYRIGLDGVKKATEFLRRHLKEGDRRASNLVRLAIQASPRVRLRSNDEDAQAEMEMTENPLGRAESAENPLGRPSPLARTLPEGETTIKVRPIIRQSINMNALRRSPSMGTPSLSRSEERSSELVTTYEEDRVYRL